MKTKTKKTAKRRTLFVKLEGSGWYDEVRAQFATKRDGFTTIDAYGTTEADAIGAHTFDGDQLRKLLGSRRGTYKLTIVRV